MNDSLRVAVQELVNHSIATHDSVLAAKQVHAPRASVATNPWVILVWPLITASVSFGLTWFRESHKVRSSERKKVAAASELVGDYLETLSALLRLLIETLRAEGFLIMGSRSAYGPVTHPLTHLESLDRLKDELRELGAPEVVSRINGLHDAVRGHLDQVVALRTMIPGEYMRAYAGGKSGFDGGAHFNQLLATLEADSVDATALAEMVRARGKKM